MDQSYTFKVDGSDKTEELKLDSAHKLVAGETVTLKDGKKAKVSSVTLNMATGKYDVCCDTVVAPSAALTAEGNDPHPERHAVKDVTLDPIFTPAVSDVNRPASENAVMAAGDVQTGTAESPFRKPKDDKAGTTKAPVRRDTAFVPTPAK